mmetsp:Transcript_26576/g.77295  ORF Transcript_26576/g.77295 Transcript_26576/m.77295 type:complete len:229 (+) Transcript_26576:350-1036(+)
MACRGGARPPRPHAGGSRAHLSLRAVCERHDLARVVVPGLHHLCAGRDARSGRVHAAGRERRVRHRRARLHHETRHRLRRHLAGRLASPLLGPSSRMLQAAAGQVAERADEGHRLPSPGVQKELVLVGGGRSGPQALSDGLRAAGCRGGGLLCSSRRGGARVFVLRRRDRPGPALQAVRGQHPRRGHQPRPPPPLPRCQLDHHLPQHRVAIPRRRAGAVGLRRPRLQV